MPGIDGFLGTRASLMLDVVVLAMMAVLPLLGFSIWLVRSRQNYAWHQRLQAGLALVLFATVFLFELDIRRHGWRHRAEASPHYATGLVNQVLGVHLFFAVTSTLLWIVVPVRALLKFSRPPAPGPHSPFHRLWGMLAAVDMVCTSVTGWIFYWLAFVS